MNTDTISRWLQSPETLPAEAEIKSLLQASPWFVPARLMEATRHHLRHSFSPQCLSLISLYGPDWILAYNLVGRVRGRKTMHRSSHAIRSDFKGNASHRHADEPVAIPDMETDSAEQPDTPSIQPLYTQDYFRHQGVEAVEAEKEELQEAEDPKTLMVMMSFAEWLSHFKIKNKREEEEERDKSALRSMWQQEKLAAALEDEPEEIPEDVFEMAVSSITREDDLASESLAAILEKQGKWSAAAEMYHKLGLRNPAKSSYFASRAEAAKNQAT